MSKWEIARLSDISKNCDNLRVPITAKDRTKGVYPYYGASGVVDYVNNYIFDEDLLLISEDGANLLARVTPIAFSIQGKTWVNNHAHVLRFPNLDTQKYVELFLNNIDISKYVTGSAQPKLNQKNLNDIIIPFPPLEIQKKIVKTIGTASELIVLRKKQLAELDNLIKSTFYDMFGDPVTNEKGWEVKRIEDVMENIRYGTSIPPVFSDDGLMFIRATNIKKGRIITGDMKYISQQEADKIGKCKLNGGELIIVRSGVNTGDTCVITEDYEKQYAGYDLIIELKREILNPMFLNELWNTNYMMALVKPLTRRAAQPHLNSDQVKSLKIPLPSINLQEQFTEIVIKIEEQKDLVKKTIDESQYLFNSLMNKFFE